jgi:hypothetical protein
MLQYLEIARKVIAEQKLRNSAETRPQESELPPVSDSRVDELVQRAAIGLLNAQGARQFMLEGRHTIGIWSSVDTGELRHAITSLYGHTVQVVHLEDARVPSKYRQQRHDGPHAPDEANRNNRNSQLNLLESDSGALNA